MKEQQEKIKAIKNLDVARMKDLLKVYSDKEDSLNITVPIQLKSDNELYSYINSIDLESYLGIYGKVNCILPEHEDHNAQAHIYTTNNGTPVYKCFGCNRSFTITSITEKLAKCHWHEAVNFIKRVYNIELIQSSWVMEQKQLMIDSANYLDSEDFKITFPELNKLIKTRKHHIKALLLHFSQYITDDMEINGKPFFYAGYNTLMDICGIRKDNPTILSKSLSLFALLNMITKMPVEDIPEKELSKAKEIAAKYKLKKITGFYSFEEYGTMLFEESEDIAKTLKENNFTLKGLSREYVLRTFSPALANKVYPQYEHENRGHSVKSEEHSIEIAQCILYLVDEKGFATEKEVVHMLGKKYSYDSTELQIKKSLQEIMLSYGLVRVKASKANKQKYGIADDEISYQSNIICRDIT